MSWLEWFVSLDGRLWVTSFLNAFCLGLQLWKMIQTRNADGVSVPMFVGFLYMQITFMQSGYVTKQWGMFWGMLASAVITLIIILLALFLQRKRQRLSAS